MKANWVLDVTPRELDMHAEFLRKHGGVYLWVYRNRKSSRVAYVGETAVFHGRLHQHLSSMLSGLYWTYRVPEDSDYVEFLKKVLLHNDEKRGKFALEQIRDCKDVYFPMAARGEDFRFARAFLNDDALAIHRDYLAHLTFAFAPLESKQDRKDLESALQIGLREIYCRQLSLPDSKETSFRLPNGTSRDTLIGRITQYPTRDFQIAHECAPGVKLPEEVAKVIGFKDGRAQIFRQDGAVG